MRSWTSASSSSQTTRPTRRSSCSRIPETAETRRVAALARTGVLAEDVDVASKLDALLDQVKDDEAARQSYVDLLELLGADDPRTAVYRKKLTSRLF